LETRFYLKSKKEEVEGIVYFIFNMYDKTRLRVSTGYKCLVADWGEGSPNPKKSSTTSLRSKLNTHKTLIDNFIANTIATQHRPPTSNELTIYIEKIHGKAKVNNENLLLTLLDKFLDKRQAEGKLIKVTRDAKSKRIKHFISYLGGDNTTVLDLNKEVIENYYMLLVSMKQEISSTNNYIKDVKSFLKWLSDKEDLTPTNYTKYIEKITENEKPVIALYKEEMDVINKANLGDRLNRVLAIFRLSCLTALRFSDVTRITKDMIDKNNILRMRQKKVTEPIVIPLIQEAVDILEQYNYEFKRISNQRANDYLKEAFKALELHRMVPIEKHTVGETIKESYSPLSSVINFHKSRKTAITSALAAGISETIVKQISGHKSDKAFRKYINYSPDTLKNEMDKMSPKAIAKAKRISKKKVKK
jgi:integrase